MRSFSLLAAALIAGFPVVAAQDEPKQQPTRAADAGIEMPDPRRPEHEALRALAGTWEYKVKMPAMPGVPGMEEEAEYEGVEHAKLVCGGLWLKWTVDGTYAGKPFQGLWLAGYDPFAETYRSIWVDSTKSTPAEMDGTFDPDTKGWKWTGRSAEGEFTSEIAWKDADTMVETIRTAPAEGQEAHTMVITRKRARGRAVPVPAAAGREGDTGLTPEHEELEKSVGRWEAVVRSAMGPDQKPTEEKGTEDVGLICGGRYTWSDFKGTMMGSPFQGHALVGYDEKTGRFTAYWIDSYSATWSKTTGTKDAASKAINLQGTCLSPTGTEMTIKQVMTWKDPDTRHLKMEFTGGEHGTTRMEIIYSRK